MSELFKFLFELGTDPLGLPIDKLQEYAILAVLGVIAYLSSYKLVGKMYDQGLLVTKIGGSFMHWTIRFVHFFAMWALTYGVIWLGTFVLANLAAILVVALVIAYSYVGLYRLLTFYLKAGGKNHA